MRSLLKALAGLTAFAATVGFAVEISLANLRGPHPRLILLDSDLPRLRELVRTDPLAQEVYRRLRKEARALEWAAPVDYRLVGPRLLETSRRCLERVYVLSLLYRLDGDSRYLVRALQEVRAAAAFPDWNPSHFLDTAEMTHAFAIAYDWLYPAISADDRTMLRRAIVEKGLNPAIAAYRSRAFWVTANHNWNLVCNGGIGIGALAVAGGEATKAAYIIERTRESLPLALASYAPDGGWAEGPAYLHYGTRYLVEYLAALQTALATDFDLSSAPGLARTGDFRVWAQGPSGLAFNFGDGKAETDPAPEMFWLAHRFSQPVYAWDERSHLRQGGRPQALDLVWFQAERRSPAEAGWPLRTVFRGVNVAFLRSGWQDQNAVYFGIKGGDNSANHSHLDLGSFVLDAGGVRWAGDLGPG